jgi:DUF4097 and DUF4098 domain-containing protein YvlB
MFVFLNLEPKFIDFLCCLLERNFGFLAIMQLNRIILAQNFVRSIYRSYVSTVKVDVKSLSSIKVKSKDFFEKEDQKVNLKIFDGQQEVDAGSLKSVEIQNTVEAFQFKCSQPQSLSIVLEMPVESSPELELDVSAGESKVFVEGMQTKSIKIDLKAGDVMLKNLKSDLIKAETDRGNISTKSLLLGKNIELEAENGVRAGIQARERSINDFLSIFRTSRSKSPRETTSKSKLSRSVSTAATTPTTSSKPQSK